MKDDEIEDEMPLRFRWEAPYFFQGKDKIIISIADEQAKNLERFQAVTVVLEASPSKDLNWEGAKLQAKKLIEKGFLIFWEVRLGLFSEIKHPLSSQAQYLSLTLALDHFRQTLWKEFQNHTFGVCLYRGTLDFSKDIPYFPEHMEKWELWLKERFSSPSDFSQPHSWESLNLDLLKEDEIGGGKQLYQIFCRDLATDFFHLLLGSLPDAVLPFLLLNGEDFKSSAELAFSLHPSCYMSLPIALKCDWMPHEGMTWEIGKGAAGIVSSTPKPVPKETVLTIGVCLPPRHRCTLRSLEVFEKALMTLKDQHIPFRLLSEETLTTQWDGLDVIWILESELTPQGKRKIQGFCAAGGEVHDLGNIHQQIIR